MLEHLIFKNIIKMVDLKNGIAKEEKNLT